MYENQPVKAVYLARILAETALQTTNDRKGDIYPPSFQIGPYKGSFDRVYKKAKQRQKGRAALPGKGYFRHYKKGRAGEYFTTIKKG